MACYETNAYDGHQLSGEGKTCMLAVLTNPLLFE